MGQFMGVFPVLIIFLQHHFAYSSLSLSSPTENINRQKLALFQFKLSLGINISVSDSGYCFDSHPKTMNWSMSSDHCTWDGVTCHEITGDVIGIDLSCNQLVGTILPNSTLFQLSHLQTLDLSGNDFSLSHQIPREFGGFAPNLMHLNLSYCGFSGKIPSEIAHLHKLVSLHLSSPSHVLSLEHEGFKFLLQNSTQLRELYLYRVDISSILPTNLSSSLRRLLLGFTGLHGELPEEVFHLPNLESLSLDGNTNLGIKFPKVKWGSSSTLTKLVLSLTNISGEIPDAIGHLRSIMILDLSSTGLHGELPEEVFHLPNLESLSLDGNTNLGIKFPKVKWGSSSTLTKLVLSLTNISGEIPDAIGHLRSIMILDLSSTGLHGELPEEVFHLPNLESLSLSGNTNLGIKFPKVKWGSSSTLTKLVLSLTNISGEIPDAIGHLRSIMILDLSSTGLHGELPEEVFHLPNLESLSLSGNTNLGIKFPKVKWGSSSTLTKLLLGLTNISGEIPDAIGHLRSIMFLALSSTGLHGGLPEEVFHLPNLESLSLYGNTNLSIKFPKVKWGSSSTLTELFLSFTNISGEISDAIGHLRSIMILDLSGCNLSGPIPNVFANLKNLSILSLADNNLNGPFPSWIVGLRELIVLDLGNNSLSGPLPPNLIGSGLQKLGFLILSNNLLNGTIPSWLFALPSLESLDLSSNMLTGQLDEYQYSTSLIDISCNNNTLFGFIPRSFLQLVNLTYLDFSSNNITGVLEIDMFSRLNNLDSLDLSNNQIHGQIPRLLGSTWGHSLRYVDLSHNLLTGGIEQFRMKNLIYLNLRSNMLNGSLSWSICNSSSLEILNLSHNNLSGVLPRCPGYLNYSLSVLDLQMNNFRGTIPSTLSNFRYLRNLNLHGNHLEGTIPRSFANFKYLEILNLGSNYMNGTFPNWLETLPNLQVLVMRSNRFNGPIRNNPKTKHPFPSLRIIDLSHNEFSGLLPEPYFKNFQAMMNFDVNRMELKYMGSDRYGYRDSVTIIIKGLEVEYVRILTVFTTIDLSSNNFEGRIPQCIGTLNSLLFLNLSHNGLGGHMPSQLGNLSMLESLDISFNQLEGEIPQQLTRLGFLASLNLSQNHLSGPIPRGKQFNTFENNSYGGNSALCGSPLSKECEKDETRAEFEEEGDSEFVSSGFTWEAVLMGYGCGIVLGFIIGYLMFLLGKPKWFTGIVDRELPHWIKV